MLYQINKGCKSYGAQDVLIDIQFEIKNSEKIAIVGRNGCGKSTLLKCICGEIDFDRGTVHKINGLSIGYLSQHIFSDEQMTALDALKEAFLPLLLLKEQLDEAALALNHDSSEKQLSNYGKLQERFEMLGGYHMDTELLTVTSQFGFKAEDLQRTISTFSGGERTRLAFSKLLLSKPDILLLDEPTNHLDIDTIEWLEGYLKYYPKAVVIVSHDRMFIDDIADEIYEIEYGYGKKYVGNYSSFVVQKKNDIERQNQAYANQQKEIQRISAQIEKFRYKKNKAAFAQSKIKYLDRLERVEKADQSDDKAMNANFTVGKIGGKNVLQMEHLVVGYDKPLFSLNMTIHRGDRLAINGPNGCGKSTLLKTIMEMVKPLSGHFMFGHQIDIAYFDQQLAQLDSDKTVLEELWDEYPELEHTQIRRVLGRFLFTADEVFKTVDVLSGGEKVRLALAKLMLKKGNFLVLDEPTNHLDIVGKEALEDALQDYEGTILFVSHDRYFIKKIATSAIMVRDGVASICPYGLTEEVVVKKVETVKKEKPVKEVNVSKSIKKIESELETLENEVEVLKQRRFDDEYIYDFVKMNELDRTIEEMEDEIESLVSKWEQLSYLSEKNIV